MAGTPLGKRRRPVGEVSLVLSWFLSLGKSKEAKTGCCGG